jgi:hypothetical protein
LAAYVLTTWESTPASNTQCSNIATMESISILKLNPS